MKKDLLFILIGLVLFIGIRIYKKYAQKGDAKQGVERKQDSGLFCRKPPMRRPYRPEELIP